MISLIGKTVRIKNIEELLFFYPEYEVKKYLTVLDTGSKVIYTGAQNKKALAILMTCEFICTEGLYQYDLTDRRKKVEFVYSKWEREVPKSILDSVDYYDDVEFDYCCKVYWIVGRWPYKPETEQSIYDLYRASVAPINEFMKMFYKSLEGYKVGIVEQSFFTFMLRAKDVDSQNVSPMYKRLLKEFYNTSGSKMRQATLQYLESPIKNRELRFINFIYDLRSPS